MVDSERIQNPWMTSHQISVNMNPHAPSQSSKTDDKLGLGERAFSAAGAAFLSAVIVNPLDVAKVLFLSPAEF